MKCGLFNPQFMPRYSYHCREGVFILNEDAALHTFCYECKFVQYTESGDALIWGPDNGVFWRTNGKTIDRTARWNGYIVAFSAGRERHVVVTSTRESSKGHVYISMIGGSQYCLLSGVFGNIDELCMNDDSRLIYSSHASAVASLTYMTVYDVHTGQKQNHTYSDHIATIKAVYGTTAWLTGHFDDENLHAFDARSGTLTDMGALGQSYCAVTAINPAMGDTLVVQTDSGDVRRDTFIYDVRACAGYTVDTIYSKWRMLPWLYIV